jgi:hypothetical protein
VKGMIWQKKNNNNKNKNKNKKNTFLLGTKINIVTSWIEETPF